MTWLCLLLDEVRDSALIVTNAIYFKGNWRRQFPKNQSHLGTFYVDPRSTINVEYMQMTNKFYYADAKELDAQILRLPYEVICIKLFT